MRGGGSSASCQKPLLLISLVLNVLLFISLWLRDNESLVVNASLSWEQTISTGRVMMMNDENQDKREDDSLKPDESPSSTTGASGFHHNKVVYAHIHMAKTAGTEINGELAARYERVCGHKGYSYDSHKHNDRASEWKQQHPNDTLTSVNGANDLYSTKFNKAWNRGRVPYDYMDEIGFQDCDWISKERTASTWKTVHEDIQPWPLEIHVPCRKPIEHLLSMCNYKQVQFQCNITTDDEIAEQVDRCLFYLHRFNESIFKGLINPKTNSSSSSSSSSYALKCFDPIPIEPYLEYMGTLLQEKRMVRPYVHRQTNQLRDKTLECLNRDTRLRQKVEQHLITKRPYFRFCNQCIGSQNDLLVLLLQQDATSNDDDDDATTQEES